MQNTILRTRRRQGSRDIEAAAAGHLDVEKNDVRSEIENLLEGVLAVLGLSDDLDVVERGQQPAQPLAGRLLVVNEEGAHHERNRRAYRHLLARRRVSCRHAWGVFPENASTSSMMSVFEL